MPRGEFDFTGTESAGRLTAGTYRVRLVSVEQKDGRNYPFWVWNCASTEPETFGRATQYTSSLSPDAAFFTRQAIEAFGGQVPSSRAKINTDEYIGHEAMALVTQDGTFTGKDDMEHDSFKAQRLFPILDGAEPDSPVQNRKPDSKPEYAPPTDEAPAPGDDDIPF